ncbi:MAG: hypothetical protein ABFD77_02735 [Thermotogota bacterium]
MSNEKRDQRSRDDESLHERDRSSRRRAARRAKLAAHFAFIRGAENVDELFACIEDSLTAAPAAAWR